MKYCHGFKKLEDFVPIIYYLFMPLGHIYLFIIYLLFQLFRMNANPGKVLNVQNRLV